DSAPPRRSAPGSSSRPRSCPTRRRPSVRTRGTISDLLVKVYRLYEQGRLDDARRLPLRAWSFGMDGLSSEQDARVALMLLRRLGFCTDVTAQWAALPDPLTIYRAGGPGLAWTADREVAASLADRYELGPIRTRTISKADALA